MVNENIGRIVKGIGGFYYVEFEGEIYTCRARGVLRKRNQKPVISDMVNFQLPTKNQEGFILDILPRRNLLKRPAVSNLDVLIITISAKSPNPDLLLCDKLLISAASMGIRPILCINKSDLVSSEDILAITSQFKHVPSVSVSCEDGSGIDILSDMITDHVVCFAGQSGVGKSSIINELIPDLSLEVGDVSRKTSSGKHTTRHVELIKTKSGGYIVDTPGFSLLEFDLLEPNKLKDDYPDFIKYEHLCRFNGCMHNKEPGCGVKEAVQENKIHKLRYDRYTKMLEDLIINWRNRYA